MKPVPKEARTQNVTVSPEKGKPPLCRYCRDDGLLAVDPQGGVYDWAYGPCPFCEAGLRFEYANPKQWPNGYWQGRDVPPDLKPITSGPMVPPPRWPLVELKDMPDA